MPKKNIEAKKNPPRADNWLVRASLHSDSVMCSFDVDSSYQIDAKGFLIIIEKSRD